MRRFVPYILVALGLAVVIAANYGDVMHGAYSPREAMIESSIGIVCAFVAIAGIFLYRRRQNDTLP